MNAAKKMFKRLVHDESGAEVIEYALIAGLIVVGCVFVIGKLGTKVLARWNSVNSSL
ncbi:MAG: Flp/Fap pilin component [Phycisphaerales bacterium]|nr:Flp/Fap pilin component [Phycisphaerales bacterium]